MDEVERVRRSVEDALGLAVKAVEPIHETGLGLRSFYRVHTAGVPDSLIVRLEAEEDPRGRPPGVPPEPGLEPLRTFLAEHDIPVPLRFGGGPGSDLLEDLGPRSLAAVLRESEGEGSAGQADGSLREDLYREACDLVVRLQKAGLDRRVALPAFERRLDRALFRYKADLFAEWSLPAALGRPARDDEREQVRAAFAVVAQLAAQAPQRLAHRDLQASNLFVRPDRRAGHRLAVIDFQGALMAPPEYDLVCLLRDSYVELPDALVQALLQRVRPRLPDPPDAASFRRRFDALTLTRKGKDHARFLYAARTRGERRFLAHVPATVRYLKTAAARCAALDPQLAVLDGWIRRLPEAAPWREEAAACGG